MIKSMTGFGKGEAVGSGERWTVEIRAVNHRYFDLSTRIPGALNLLEDKIRRYVNKDIKRGKVNFFLGHKKAGKDNKGSLLNIETAERNYKMLCRIKAKLGLKDEISLEHILSIPDIFIQEEEQYDINAVWTVIESAVEKALKDCLSMREKEGKALYKDLDSRISKIASAVNNIHEFIPDLVMEYKKNMEEKVNNMIAKNKVEVDQSRLATELAIFARQTDVSEEITRAKSHLQALKDAISTNHETGRRIDFLLQELQREINTLGAKISHIKAARLVVDIKSEIEKMREQAQNVE